MSLVARGPRVSSLIIVGCLFAVSAMGFTAYLLRDPKRAPHVEPFFVGLGDYQRKVTTNSPLAQKYFDQGLAFLYGFNYTESARSFEAAAEADPQCQWPFGESRSPTARRSAIRPLMSRWPKTRSLPWQKPASLSREPPPSNAI